MDVKPIGIKQNFSILFSEFSFFEGNSLKNIKTDRIKFKKAKIGKEIIKLYKAIEIIPGSL